MKILAKIVSKIIFQNDIFFWGGEEFVSLNVKKLSSFGNVIQLNRHTMNHHLPYWKIRGHATLVQTTSTYKELVRNKWQLLLV